jgi:hypothetical protein
MNLEQLLSSLVRLISGTRGKRIVSEIARFHRIQGSPEYDDALGYIRGLLQGAGIETRVERFPADGRAKTYEWTAPPAWTVHSGRLIQSEPDEEGLVSFDEIPQAIIVHSPAGRFEGELVHVGKGDRPADYEGVDIKGKFVLSSGRAAEVEKEVRKRGGIGFLIYPDGERAAPSYDLIQYQGIFPIAEEIPSLIPGFSVSKRIADRLLSRLNKGTVRLRGEIDARFTNRELSVLEATVGGGGPNGEVLLVSHLCHPRQSANDNASGSAALAERFGVPELAVTVNRLEVPMHDPRAFVGLAVTYALSPRGACHLQGDMYGVDTGQGTPVELGVLPGDRFDSSEEKGRVAARQQAWRNLYNALTLCVFQNPGVERVLAALNGVTGWGLEADDLMTLGKRIVTLKRVLNKRLGLTRRTPSSLCQRALAPFLVGFCRAFKSCLRAHALGKVQR